MCELFGISSNHPAKWCDRLTLFGKRGGETADNPDGWGLIWRKDNVWHLYKAPESATRSEQFATLSQSICTDLLIAHVRKANPPSPFTLENTHPFLRECCGRSWAFAHNGKVPEVVQPLGCCHPHASNPRGDTDSEHAFYFLLDEIANVFSEIKIQGHSFWLQKLAQLSEDIASYGQFNFLMSDGVVLIAYGHDRLYHQELQQNGIKITLLASEPLNNDGSWQAFQTGELRVYHEGALIGQLQTTPTWFNDVDTID